MKVKKFYYYSCLLFILLMPLENISFFDIGFKGSITNIFIILIFLKLATDYLLFNNFRKIINYRIYSRESKYLLLPLIIVMTFDTISNVYHGGIGFLTDRIGSVLLVLIFIVGVDSYKKLLSTITCWIFASSYLALQNILSNLNITPVVEGARFHQPRNFYGLDMPFHYAVGFPGAFGWHGMLLVSGFLFSIFYIKHNRLVGFLGSALCLASIVMMQSRSTYLAFIISLIVYLLISSFANNKYKQFTFILFPLIFFFIYYLPELVRYIPYLWEGFVNVARGNVDGRLLQFRVSIETGLSNCFLGVGHNYLFDGKLDHVIHNSFLYQLASIGIFGFFVYCYIYFNVIKVSFQSIFSRKFFSNELSLMVVLFSIFIGICIELSLFRVISGKEQWLIIYFILLYSSLMSAARVKIERAYFKKSRHYRR